ncbi:hypothetical protein HOH30_01045 [Candidatus Woesearchaeota archaeon]|nr:hypothetical protein [Candidatus Woesearchaeota archaeon]
MGLVDQLGDKHTAETYMKERYDIENVDYVTYQQDVGILDILTSVFSQFSFHVGRGFNSLMVEQQQSVMLL